MTRTIEELKIHAIKLASNENPLLSAPLAMEAVKRTLGESHRSPDGGTHRLREKLAALHGVTPEEIFIALGSSELIDLASRVLLRAGRAGLTSEGSYAPFSIAIRASGAELKLVPEREEFAGGLRDDVLIVLDEAYIHYAARADMPHSVELYRKRRNLLVLRTFSKVFGLAGLRIGYGIGRAGLVTAMNKLRDRKS